MVDTAQVSLFDPIRQKYPAIYVIISPPRCSSTALARVFWQQPTIRYYSHEPFEITYYDGAKITAVVEKLHRPINISDERTTGQSLIIKEMPYQVGANFGLLATLATQPIVFLIRDPRLNIASRMKKKIEVGDSPDFPKIETGWQLLQEQIAYCREHGVEYTIVDATTFRNCPEQVFPQLFARFGLDYSAEMLHWRARRDIDLDNLGGAHRHLYERVLLSTGIQPATETVPPLDWFPVANGWREHVAHCLEIFGRIQRDPYFLHQHAYHLAA